MQSQIKASAICKLKVSKQALVKLDTCQDSKKLLNKAHFMGQFYLLKLQGIKREKSKKNRWLDFLFTWKSVTFVLKLALICQKKLVNQ